MPFPTAHVLSIGTELLKGHTVDTNAAFLSGELDRLGWTVSGITAVGDHLPEIADAIHRLAKKNRVLLLTGGLGPTGDDRTREAIAAALGVELEERAELLEQIAARFRRHGWPMRPINRVQARIPAGAEAIPNPHGTAPGILARVGPADLYALPGVPREMRALFSEWVVPRLPEREGGDCRFMRRVHLIGVGESTLGEAIAAEMSQVANPEVGTTVRDGIITVRIVASGSSETETRTLADGVARRIRAIFPREVFGEDGETLSGVVLSLLAERGSTLACAESCTGGLLASALVDHPGASEVLIESVVAYANDAKVRRLAVGAELLASAGAVSGPVVRAMAEGARARSGADYAIAVTGVAGPGGGTEAKPVGTTWFGLADAEGTHVFRRCLGSNREGNRLRAVQFALDALRRRLQGLPLPEET